MYVGNYHGLESHTSSLLKRRQIRNSRPCAIATAELLLRVVAMTKIRDHGALITRVRQVGHRLVLAQPRELAVGNIVRRVLGVIRDVLEQDASGSSDVDVSRTSSFAGLMPTSLTSPVKEHKPDIDVGKPRLQSTNSLFGLLGHPPELMTPSPTPPTGTQSPIPGYGSSLPHRPASSVLPETQKLDIKAEVIDGIKMIIAELESVDADIAPFAQEHIHSDEVILTHTSSRTVQNFLLAAARKRKFTVVHVESYPNDHEDTHRMILNGHKAKEEQDSGPWKRLTEAGITVIMIPDSAVFALMSRVNKVILTPHSVLASGGLIAASGAMLIAQAAKAHKTPVVVVSGVYKLSPVYHFETGKLIEMGDPGRVVSFAAGSMVEAVEVKNPMFDFVPAELVDLYITNL